MVCESQRTTRTLNRGSSFIISGEHITGTNTVDIEWIKKPWHDRYFPASLLRIYRGPTIILSPPHNHLEIQTRVKRTNKLGMLPLWNGYGEKNGKRAAHMVASQTAVCHFYTELVKQARPSVVTEIGTGFGVSGMHWLSGLESNQRGQLYTYEVNDKWAEVARSNLNAISNRFTLTVGKFEDTVDYTLKKRNISIGFIDGVHTSEWVMPQYNLIRNRLESGGIIILDDITFSKDMEMCWRTILSKTDAKYAAVIQGRVGMLLF